MLTSYAFFRSVFNDVASRHSDVDVDHVYVDAMTARQVLHPDALDVIVAENMFGDILSDLGQQPSAVSALRHRPISATQAPSSSPHTALLLILRAKAQRIPLLRSCPVQ